MLRSFALLAALLVVPAQALAAALFACGSIAPRNEPVAIASESAIIIWDEDTKMQHFIRRASFETKATDFGFLVPTPAQPTLQETDDTAFGTLFEITKPKVEKRAAPAGGGGCGCGSADKAVTGSAKGSVEVLDEVKGIGGFDAVVLKASDPGALEGWLKKNEYPFPDSLRQWAEPYTKKGWIITAFKMAKVKAEDPRLATAGIRMSFETDAPLFPYREPKAEKDASGGARLLRVYFLAKARMTAKLSGAEWPGKTVWAGKIDADKRDAILKMVKLPENTPPEAWWLTEFEDRSAVRPGDSDLYFSVSADQNPLERPVHVVYAGRACAGCLMSCALGAYLLGLAALRRRAGDR